MHGVHCCFSTRYTAVRIIYLFTRRREGERGLRLIRCVRVCYCLMSFIVGVVLLVCSLVSPSFSILSWLWVPPPILSCTVLNNQGGNQNMIRKIVRYVTHNSTTHSVEAHHDGTRPNSSTSRKQAAGRTADPADQQTSRAAAHQQSISGTTGLK